MLFKKFYTWLIIGLRKDLAGLLNQLILTTLTLQVIDLSGSSYVKLPDKLRSPRKGLLNIKNKDQKYFLWCHGRHIHPVEIHFERITKADKKLVKHITNPEKLHKR